MWHDVHVQLLPTPSLIHSFRKSKRPSSSRCPFSWACSHMADTDNHVLLLTRDSTRLESYRQSFDASCAPCRSSESGFPLRSRRCLRFCAHGGSPCLVSRLCCGAMRLPTHRLHWQSCNPRHPLPHVREWRLEVPQQSIVLMKRPCAKPDRRCLLRGSARRIVGVCHFGVVRDGSASTSA